MSDGIELTDDEYDTFITVLAEQRCQHSHADTACPPPPERAILTDLIAELRGEHWRDSAGYCAVCENKTCCVSTVLNRAEARLKELE